MNLWAMMLAELPALGQKQVARANRVSLPRGCDGATRLALLRAALCHEATVRVTYLALEPHEQAALQELRERRGGIATSELVERFGTVRSWRQIADDRRPQSLAERLLLLGWLLPRPAAPRHPPRWIVPPEVRRWLPRPLVLADAGAAAAPPPPPLLQAARTLLEAAQVRPLPCCADGSLRRPTLRQIVQAGADDMACVAFCQRVLVRAGALVLHNGRASCTVVGQRWLRGAPAEQWATLQRAWLLLDSPDALLERELVNDVGMDWSLLRRKLLSWVAALPQERRLEEGALYGVLAGAFGPLGDSWTHGFRTVDRVPWQPRRAEAVWTAALRGPLRWLGYSRWEQDADGNAYVVLQADPAANLSQTPSEEPPDEPQPRMQLREAVVVQAEPTLLREAAQARSVRRALGERLAPGVALVERTEVAALERALARKGIGLEGALEPLAKKPAPALELAPGDCAALLVAWALAAAQGPAELRAAQHPRVEQQLLSALPRALREATEARIGQLCPLPSGACAPPSERLAVDDARALLRRAVREQRALVLVYDTGGVGAWSERTVRPLEVWQRNGEWYVRAFCLLAQAERTFRIDRIAAIGADGGRFRERRLAA